MSYHFELRPRDLKPLSVEEFKRRLFDFGFFPHPGLADPNKKAAIKEKYVDDVESPVGIIAVQTSESSHCGVTAFVRANPSHTTIVELLKIASAMNADLYDGRGQMVSEQTCS